MTISVINLTNNITLYLTDSQYGCQEKCIENGCNYNDYQYYDCLK